MTKSICSPRHTKANPAPDRRIASGFTLIELLVVIAIIAILAAILFPVFGRARENARRSSCQSNMKQMGLGIVQYVQDYDEYYPTSAGAGTGTWRQKIQPYLKSTQVLRCPSNPENNVNALGAPPLETKVSYAAACRFDEDNTATGVLPNGVGVISCTSGNNRPVHSALLQDTTKVIALVETTSQQNYFNITDTGSFGVNTQHGGPPPRGHMFAGHLSTTNFLFADGHVKSLKPLSSMNEASVPNPGRVNLWRRDNTPFINPQFTAARNTLTFAESKYK